MIKTTDIQIRIVFLEEALGTAPADPRVFHEYVSAKAPDPEKTAEEDAAHPNTVEAEEEMDEVTEEELKKAPTVFLRDDDGTPILLDYMIKGFLKEAGGHLNRCPGSIVKDTKAYLQRIEGNIFVLPRRVRLILPEGATMGVCVRPLRVNGPRGQRVCIAKSETVPVGTYMDVTFRLLDEKLQPMLEELLDYGQYRGLCQWRGGSKGRISWARLNRPIAAQAA